MRYLRMYSPRIHDVALGARGLAACILFFTLLFPMLAWATITVDVKDDFDAEHATLLIKDNGRIVKSMTVDPGVPAKSIEVNTFPTTYCGNKAQVVILDMEVSDGAQYGSFYKYLILNPKNRTVMDDFGGAKIFDRGTNKLFTDTGHDKAVKLLREGRYVGPVCRIYDLYTKPLPPSGPSFDCKTASTLAEQTVCKDPKLTALDRAYGASIQKALRATSPAERQNIANKYMFDMDYRNAQGNDKKEIARVYGELLGKNKDQTGSVSVKKTTAATCSQVRTPTEGAICGNPLSKNSILRWSQPTTALSKTLNPILRHARY